jgi:hypothetical protein
MALKVFLKIYSIEGSHQNFYGNEGIGRRTDGGGGLRADQQGRAMPGMTCEG